MKRIPAVLLFGLLALALSGVASASITPGDLFTSGDKLLTIDSSTGLQWLNVPLTAGQSYNSVMAGYGLYTTSLGFRYATMGEVQALLADAKVPLQPQPDNGWGWWDFSNPNYLATVKLVSQLGATYPDDGLSVCTLGITAGVGGAYICYNNHADTAAWAPYVGGYPYVPDFNLTAFDSQAQIGSFLVRGGTPTPEPSELALLGTGLSLIAMLRRKWLA